MRRARLSASKPISDVQPSRPSLSSTSISEVSRLPDDPHLIDGEAGARRDRLHGDRQSAADHRRRRARWHANSTAVAIEAAKRGGVKSPAAQPRDRRDGPAQPARQHEMVGGKRHAKRAAAVPRCLCHLPDLNANTRRPPPSNSTARRNRVPCMRGDFGHQRRRRHAGLRVDFEPDDLAIFRMAVVVAKVRSGNAPAADCLMSLERQCLYFLVNIW